MTQPTPDTATILVVDDERGPRESLRMILAPTHQVLLAEGGAEALETLRTTPVDLVTLDLNMPGMKGDYLMRAIRQEFPEVEIIVITGTGSLDTAAEAVRHGISDYLQKPFDVVQVTASVVKALEKSRGRRRIVSFLSALGSAVGRDRQAQAILADLRRSEGLRGNLGALLERCGSESDAACDATRTVEFLEVLAETIETKDRSMRGHCRRVSFYSALLAERLCLPRDERENLRIAAFLHDVGKVGVPTDLLLRADVLSEAERRVVEQHPAIGAELIRPLGMDATIPSAVRHHHEWWNGTGYPDGLRAEQIPLAARVISVADAFDAMNSDRPYRRALPREVAISELRRFAGIQFDPDLAKEFVSILETGVCDVDLGLMADAVASARPAADGRAPTLAAPAAG